jgi:hypothetical protein
MQILNIVHDDWVDPTVQPLHFEDIGFWELQNLYDSSSLLTIDKKDETAPQLWIRNSKVTVFVLFGRSTWWWLLSVAVYSWFKLRSTLLLGTIWSFKPSHLKFNWLFNAKTMEYPWKKSSQFSISWNLPIPYFC